MIEGYREWGEGEEGRETEKQKDTEGGERDGESGEREREMERHREREKQRHGERHRKGSVRGREME